MTRRPADGGASEYLDQIANEIDPKIRREALLCLRDACMDSIRAKESVGTVGIPVLLSILRDEKDKHDLIAPVLETLVNCIQPLSSVPESTHSGDIGYINSEQVIRIPESTSMIIVLLDEEDFFIKYNATLLLSTLLKYNVERMQEAVLSCPMGVVKILDLLSEQNAVRNEALTLLQLLASGHAEIQKICAFEGTFARVFDIIVEEGGLEGTVTVQKCLELINSLIRGSSSNQAFFRESGFVLEIVQTLEKVKSISFNRQRTINTLAALQTIYIMCTPCLEKDGLACKDGEHELKLNQDALGKSNVLQALFDLSLAADAPSSWVIRAAALQCISSVLDGSITNFDQFIQISEHATPALKWTALECCLSMAMEAEDPSAMYCSALIVHSIYCTIANDSQRLDSVASLLVPSPGQSINIVSRKSLVEILLSPWGTHDLQAISLSALFLGYFAAAPCIKTAMLEHDVVSSTAPLAERIISSVLMHISKLQNTDEENICTLHLLYFLNSIIAESPVAAHFFHSKEEHALLLLDLVHNNAHRPAETLEAMISRMASTLFGLTFLAICTRSMEQGPALWDGHTMLDLLMSRIGIYRFLQGWAELVHDFSRPPPNLFGVQNNAKFQLSQQTLCGLYFDLNTKLYISQMLEKCKHCLISLLSIPHHTGDGNQGRETQARGSETTGDLSSRFGETANELYSMQVQNQCLMRELAHLATEKHGELHESGISPSSFKALLEEKAQVEVSLRNACAGKEELETKLVSANQEMEAIRDALASSRLEAERMRHELLQLSNVYHTVEEQNRSLRETIDVLKGDGLGSTKANGTDPCEVQKQIDNAVAAALATAQEEADESLNDLLVCLGQSERGVQILSEKLRELGVEPELLISEATNE